MPLPNADTTPIKARRTAERFETSVVKIEVVIDLVERRRGCVENAFGELNDLTRRRIERPIGMSMAVLPH